MDTNLISILNKFTEISSVNNTGKSQKNSACDTSFETTMREQQINNTKEEIYNKFHVDVNNANGKFECYISSDVLYRMNTDSELKSKVYAMLEDYTSDKFQTFCKTFDPPVKKCTLMFDENGDVVSTLEPDMEKLEKSMGKANKCPKISVSNKEVYHGSYSEGDFVEGMQALLSGYWKKNS